MVIKRNNIIKDYTNIKNALNTNYVKNEKLYTFHDFSLTKRHGKIVSRELEKYVWSSKARLTQKLYHLTKNGLPKTNNKLSDDLLYVKAQIDKDNKQRLLESRPFSYFHNRLIENLYNKRSWKEKTMTAQAKAAKHEIELENIAKRLSDYKSSLKLRNPKNLLYKISSYYSDGKQHIKLLSETYVPKEPTCDEIAELNRSLSVYPFYRHTVVRKKGEKTDRFLFVSTNLAA